ncbi:VOC family protein [Neobacillus rhizosphaerae]|uniref:VOC family protein n=1 Tax=Neobacillus rhizosphaerae TaxID=2880965 RepID=UPI003D2C4D33
MSFSFDHLVIFLKKPEEVILPLKEKGLHAVNGGHHQWWGTYNSLSYFGLSYIEFLGIEDLSIAEKQRNNRLITEIVEQLSKQGHEGPAKIAIGTRGIQQLAKRLQAEGNAVYGPFPGERVRADGQIIRWSLLFLENEPNKLTMPFFIEWEKSDEERLVELKEQGLIEAHRIGNPIFQSVGFVVQNLENTITKWGELLNLEPSEEFIDAVMNARCRKLELSGTSLLFCTPLGEGRAKEVLEEKGETPFIINLEGTNQTGMFELFGGFWREQ